MIFEALPNKANWDYYLGNAKMLRPELEQVEGFVDNIRYVSLTRGWLDHPLLVELAGEMCQCRT